MHVGSYVNRVDPVLKCALSMCARACAPTHKPLLTYTCAHMCSCLQICPYQYAEVNKHVFHVITVWFVELNARLHIDLSVAFL